MSDGKLAGLFFEIGMVLTVISMVLGPFDITNWSIASATIACFTALAGIYLAFGSWDEPDEPDEQEKLEEPQSPEPYDK